MTGYGGSIGDGGPIGDAGPARRRSLVGRIIFWSLTGLAAATVLGGFAWTFASLRGYVIPARSMENTVPAGARVLAEQGRAARRGDLVILLLPPQATGQLPGLVIKRLIGLPGDHVACCDAHGRVTVDGRPLSETYLYPGDRPSAVSFSVTLRKGQIWVLGDHRIISFDSRGFGPLPMSAITGRVVLIGGNGSTREVRTPPAFITDGLAPPDHRPPLPLAPLGTAGAGAIALLALAVFGLIRTLLRLGRRS